MFNLIKSRLHFSELMYNVDIHVLIDNLGLPDFEKLGLYILHKENIYSYIPDIKEYNMKNTSLGQQSGRRDSFNKFTYTIHSNT